MEKNLGAFIKQVRTEKNISAKELAQKSGISVVDISYIENGQVKKPNLVTLKRISEALECNFETLYEHYE